MIQNHVSTPEMLSDLKRLIAIPSKYTAPEEGMPYGKGVHDALEFFRCRAETLGFVARNLGYITEIVYGEGQETVYIACHGDVVPEGDGWHSDPFRAEIRDGRVYGRGAIDNKGPAVAVLHALAALKRAGIQPKKQIRLLIGGDEERGMQDLKTYVAEYGLPDYGLTPDSQFPIVNTEVGVLFGDLCLECREDSTLALVRLESGRAYNCVPDFAVAELRSAVGWDPEEISAFEPSVSAKVQGGRLLLEAVGRSAHGSVPWEGKSALLLLAGVLKTIWDRRSIAHPLLELLVRYLSPDCNGSAMGLYCEDALCGPLSFNVGLCRYEAGRGFLGLDLRIPATVNGEEVLRKLETFARTQGAEFRAGKLDPGTHIPAETPFMQKLAAAYEKACGKKAAFLTARGVTYAKAFGGRGVAFGPAESEEGEECGNLHGPDEYVAIKTLENLAQIYYTVLRDLFC